MCSCVYMKWVKVAQTYPTLCNPMDCIVIGILQARTLEWVAFPFSSESSQPRNRTGISYIAGWLFTNWAMMASVYMWSEVKSLSRVRLFVTPWMVAHQASPSMEFSRHEYWSRLPLPSPGDLPDPGIEPRSPAFSIYVCVYICIYVCIYYVHVWWHPTPVLLPGKSHGRRSLEGCSLWGRWGSDTTEWLHFHFSPSCIGEGNGNPLQCSCLGESQGWGSLVGCRLWGRTESDTTEVT